MPSQAASAPVVRAIDPTTGQVLAELPCATREDVGKAVEKARNAQSGWASLGLEGRAATLLRIADRFEDADAVDRLARLVTAEMGKPLRDARGEAEAQAPGIRKLVAQCRQALAPVETRKDAHVSRTSREPLGVVAAITPWNFPLGMARSVVVPALMAGNAVVFKPSPIVPQTGAAFRALFASELPEDVMGLVQGGDATGKALVAADIDMVGFVGSVAAGRHIMSACGASLKRLVLELGGKDPMIVCADADLDAAAEYAVRESMRNSGQVCCAVERIYVEEPVARAFADRVVERARALVVGRPTDDVFMGPMASEEQRRKVVAQVEDAAARGARVELGGRPMDGPGWFMPPTVVTGVDESMDLMTEETFGPVATIRTVRDADHAVELANDSPFGLGATVWTGDADRGRALAARLQSGMVGINRGIGGAGDTPWAGVKQSGFGFLGSPDGHRMFTRPLTVSWTEGSGRRR